MNTVNPAEWKDQLKQFSAIAEEQKKDLYFYVTATVNPETGKAWCPDCVKSEPFIKAAMEQLKDKANFVSSALERNAYKGMVSTCVDGQCVLQAGEKHPYVLSEELKLSCIPTLYKWNTKENKVEDKLLEEKCYDQEALNAFLKI